MFFELSWILQLKYTEEYEQQRGKGSFPAMITPAYLIAKRANELASNVSFKSKLCMNWLSHTGRKPKPYVKNQGNFLFEGPSRYCWVSGFVQTRFRKNVDSLLLLKQTVLTWVKSSKLKTELLIGSPCDLT